MKPENIPFGMLYTREQLDEVGNEEVLFIEDGVLIPYNYSFSFDKDEEPIEVDTFVVNPLLVDELLVNFNFYLDGQVDFFVDYEYNKFKLKIELEDSLQEKNKVLNKVIKKYKRKLRKLEIVEDFFSCFNEVDLRSKESIQLLKNSIAHSDEIIEDFLVNGYNMLYYEHELLGEYEDALCYNGVLDRLNKFKFNLVSSIFVDDKAEEIFHEVLLNENVIDEEGNLKRGFQNVSYNFFCMPESVKSKIFKKNVDLKAFAKFLEDKYSKKVQNPDKMGNKNHLIDTITKQVRLLLETNNFL